MNERFKRIDLNNSFFSFRETDKIFRYDNKIFFHDEFNQDSVNDFMKLSYEILPIRPIDFEVSIHSFGGSVFELFRLIDFLHGDVFPNTYMPMSKVEGVACSAASIFFCVFPFRLMTKNSHLMFHEMSSSHEHQELTKLKNWTKHLEKQSDSILDILIKNTKIKDKKKWREIFLEETWFSAKEAKDLGIINGIIGEDDIDEIYLNIVSGKIGPDGSEIKEEKSEVKDVKQKK